MERISNPFAQYAKEYIAMGYSVIPISYGEKRPVIAAWTRFTKYYPNDNQIVNWCTKQHNIGICTGQLSGVIGLDLDADYNNTHAKILSVIPDSPVKKRGNKGFTAFYRYNGEHSRTLSTKGHQIGDLLSDGRQCVLPPSLHPNGRQYEWRGPSLLDIPKCDLPIITTDMWMRISTILQPARKRPQLIN